MRTFFFASLLGLAAPVAVLAQSTSATQASSNDLILAIDARRTSEGGTSSAGDHGNASFSSYTYSPAQDLCGLGTGDDEPSRTPWVGWYYTGEVLGSSIGAAGPELNVRIRWERRWNNGARTNDGPSGTNTVTMRGGDVLVLDRVTPATPGRCGNELRLEASVMSASSRYRGMRGASVGRGGMATGGVGVAGGSGRGGRGGGVGGVGVAGGVGAGATGGVTGATAAATAGVTGRGGVSSGRGRGGAAAGGGGGVGVAGGGTGATTATAGTAATAGAGTGRGGRGGAIAGTAAGATAAGTGATTTIAGGGRGGRGGGAAARGGGAASTASGVATQGRGGRGTPNAERLAAYQNQIADAVSQLRRTAEIWLLHRTPDGVEHVQLQTVTFTRSARDFSFPPVAVTTSRGVVMVDINGSLRITDNQIAIGLSRRARASGAQPLDTTGSSEVSFDLPKPEEVTSFEFPALQKPAEDLLAKHKFSVRVRVR